ncbi:hypothetical protein J6524_35625 [Bradyrhizobium sp. WSM 1738]|nr:hypothetical protein [Bradyrhizobium hereditatis]MCA6120129.1 hypothetical protein [Bradyrhizobium hereditatis]
MRGHRVIVNNSVDAAVLAQVMAVLDRHQPVVGIGAILAFLTIYTPK